MVDIHADFHPNMGFEDPAGIEDPLLRDALLEAQTRFVESSVSDGERSLVTQLAGRMDDPDLIQHTLETQKEHLSPQTTFLLAVSEAAMRERHARQRQRNVAEMNHHN